MNNYQILFNVAFTIAGFLGAFILSAIWGKISQLETADKGLVQQIGDVKVAIATLSANHDQETKKLDLIFEKLDKIDEKLDRKADK